MSTKSLDLLGRPGAIHHLIRRKAAAQDFGLITLKDIQNKIVCLPLTTDGVFGKELEEKLKNVKKRLIERFNSRVEWQRSEKKIHWFKCKLFKRQSVTSCCIYSKSNGRTKFQRPSLNTRADYRQSDKNTRSATATSNTMSDRTSSFHIPKKSNEWLGKCECKQFYNVSRDTSWGRLKYVLKE